MSGAFEAISDVVEGVVDFAGEAVESIADVVVDEAEKLGKTIQGVIEDPLPTIVSLAGQAVGIPAPITMAAITASRGGDLQDIALSAAVSYAMPAMASSVGSTLSSSIGESIANDAVKKTVVNGVTSGLVNGTIAEIRGGDFTDGFAGGFTGEVVGSGVKDFVNLVKPEVAETMISSGLDPKTANTLISAGAGALTSGLTSEILGTGDFGTSFTNSLISSGTRAIGSVIKDTVKSEFGQALKIDDELGITSKPSTPTVSSRVVADEDGMQYVYDQDGNLVDIVEAPAQITSSSEIAPEPVLSVLGDQQIAPEKPDALVPDASNPNLEAGKTPQERAADEWNRYLQSLGSTPDALDLPPSSIEAGKYWDEYNQNLKRIMDQGGFTSQWQSAAGDRVFVNDDGTAIGVGESGESYSLSKDQVDQMVSNGLLNTAESGYVAATGGSGNTPGGSAPAAPSGGQGGVRTRTATRPNQGTTQIIINQAAPAISRAIQDEPMKRPGLPIYEKMDQFEGPLSDFLEMVQKNSYTSQPNQPETMQPNMNQPMPPDRLDQPANPAGGYFNYGQESSIDAILNPGEPFVGFKQGGMASPLMAAGGTTRYGMNSGGALNVVHHAGKPRLDFREGAAVTGEGDGQSDDIPAMLADGEFVFPADVVAALGNGSTKAGSDKLYEMMHSIREYHRAAKPEDLPPPAKKSPLDYLKKPARKARG